ncbi:hypothetical protein [Cellulosimicrobium sp. Marseille-Q8652]
MVASVAAVYREGGDVVEPACADGVPCPPLAADERRTADGASIEAPGSQVRPRAIAEPGRTPARTPFPAPSLVHRTEPR